MVKLPCTDIKSGTPPDGLRYLLSGYVPGDVEVVMIMPLEMVNIVLEWQVKNEGDLDPFKQLGVKSDQLKSGGDLELPRLELLPNGALRIDDGRHRSAYFRDKGMQVIPFLTYERVALLRERMWGSIAVANSLYDFSACHPRRMLGNP